MLNFYKRLKVSGVYFVITLLLLIFPLLFVTSYLYPGLLFWLDGGWQALQIIFLVNIIAGPLLVFFVYKVDKKHFYKDVAAIAAIQMVAAMFGFYALYSVRPVAFVFDEKSFFTVSKSQITKDYVAVFEKQIVGKKNDKVPMFIVSLPSDLKQKRQIAEEMAKSGRPFYVNPNLWESNINASNVCLNETLINKLKKVETRSIALNMLKELSESECLAMIQLRFGQALVVFDKNSGLILSKYKEVNLGHLAED